MLKSLSKIKGLPLLPSRRAASSYHPSQYFLEPTTLLDMLREPEFEDKLSVFHAAIKP